MLALLLFDLMILNFNHQSLLLFLESLIRKRDDYENNGEVDGDAKEKDNEDRFGALERIKKLKQN